MIYGWKKKEPRGSSPVVFSFIQKALLFELSILKEPHYYP